MKSLSDLFRKKHSPVVVVSGLPRSGTSMMMEMLEKGGIPPLTDRERTADEDNPRGYYEYERVKKLRDGDTSWLAEAGGKAVKVIAFLLEFLPSNYAYMVIFMRRAMPEVLSSQREMLVRRGEAVGDEEESEMARIFEAHMASVVSWAKRQKNIRFIEVDYNRLLTEPEAQVEALRKFLGNELDAQAMLQVIDPGLYRNRSAK